MPSKTINAEAVKNRGLFFIQTSVATLATNTAIKIATPPVRGMIPAWRFRAEGWSTKPN